MLCFLPLSSLLLLVAAVGLNLVSSAPFHSANDEYVKSLTEGSSCTFNSKAGICVAIPECPSIHKTNKHRKHIPYERCGFNGYTEIVCCTDESVIKRKGPGFSTEVIWDVSVTKPVNKLPKPTRPPVRSPAGERQSKLECEKLETSVPAPDVTITQFILGGEDAAEEEFPHMAALGYESLDVPGTIEFNCGGSLISKRWVLTAAHCMIRQENLPIVIRLGVINITAEAAKSTDYDIEERIRHPQYNRRQKLHDIALIKMTRDVVFSSRIHPACLYQVKEEPLGAIATGWGITDDRKGSSCTFQSQPGVCVKMMECKSAREALLVHRYTTEQRCGFSGHFEIVCCTEEEVVKQKNVSSTTALVWGWETIPHEQTPAPSSVDSRHPELTNTIRISQQECEKYKNSIPAIDSFIDEFIVNGENATEGEFPHMVALGYKNTDNIGGPLEFKCGGSLISKRYVLTAAHCMRGSTKPIIARIGALNIETVDLEMAKHTDYGIKNIRSHNYNKKLKYNDIALLELDRDVKYSHTVYPACLYQSDTNPPTGVATGHGIINERTEQTSPVLQKGTLKIISLDSCNSTYVQPGKAVLTPNQLCAISATDKPTDSCRGDSGGPLQFQNFSRSLVEGERIMYEIVGITSFGADGCGSSFPGVYTKVFKYLDWIEKIVWPA